MKKISPTSGQRIKLRAGTMAELLAGRIGRRDFARARQGRPIAGRQIKYACVKAKAMRP